MGVGAPVRFKPEFSFLSALGSRSQPQAGERGLVRRVAVANPSDIHDPAGGQQQGPKVSRRKGLADVGSG